MASEFLRIKTSNGEERWINLARVTRVTLAKDPSGEQAMTFCFDGTDKVTIHGSDGSNRDSIRRLTQLLDQLAVPASKAA